MNFSLKDKPLYFQIWVILGLVLGISFALITVIIPVILSRSFYRENFSRIEEVQSYLLEQQDEEFFIEDPESFLNGDRISRNDFFFQGVNHIFLTEDGEILGNMIGKDMPAEISVLKNTASGQEQKIKNYTRQAEDDKMMFVIRKTKIGDKQGYFISYILTQYQDNFLQMIFIRLVFTLIFILIISWLASRYIARYLTRPINKLQTKVEKIASREWETPVGIDRRDEIGKLGKKVEWMRKKLLEQDQRQQSFLQQLSHELKNPVMIIKSYAQSIYDGIYPRGDLESSIKIIEEETDRLEKKVSTLIDLTKYEYLADHRLKKSSFELADLIKEKVDIFSWRRSELEWELNLLSVYINGDREKMGIALDNIFDNQLRYAESKIKISVNIEGGNSYLKLRIWNDGPEIIPDLKDEIFDKYSTGTDGNHGLGLAIVKKIVDLHQGQVKAVNEDGGVAFYIILPLTDR